LRELGIFAACGELGVEPGFKTLWESCFEGFPSALAGFYRRQQRQQMIPLRKKSRLVRTHPVDVAILKDRFRKTSLGHIQHGATYAVGRRHVVRKSIFNNGYRGFINA
jgi:hypothetical protein